MTRSPSPKILPVLLIGLLAFVPCALSAERSPVQVEYEKGTEHLAAGRYEEAAASFWSCLPLLEPGDPAMAAVYLNLGISQANLGQVEDAAESFARSVQADPGVAVSRLYLGTADRLLDRPFEAIPQFLEALRLQPTLSRAHDELWQTYASIGAQYGYDRHLILRQAYHMEKLLSVEPEYPKAYPDIYKKIKLLVAAYDRLGKETGALGRRYDIEQQKVRSYGKGLEGLLPLPDDGIPPAERERYLEKVRAR